MASSKDYLAYVMDLLADVPDARYRAMMGEYVLYAGDKVFGGIYDDRFLVKDIPAAKRLLPDSEQQIPYPGAKPMLSVTIEDKRAVAELVAAMVRELPRPKKAQGSR